MKRMLTGLLGLILTLSTQAQTIKGMVKDENGKPLAAANTTLHRANDSSLVKFTVTNGEGGYEFAGIGEGNYFVQITHVGHEPAKTAVFSHKNSGESQVPVLTMQKQGTSLQNVTVVARKPMIEVKADKMVVNVEGTINAVGNDALELLRKSPGVQLDKDDNISLSGKNGVQVYIDGKPSPLSGADLTAYLKSMQSSQIETIEIITNPSAKYDAAGNAGIINIRLKKNKSFGTNGSMNAGYNIGTFPKYNGGVNLNHRDKGINIFGSYNYNWNKNTNQFLLYREQLDTLFDQRNTMFGRNRSHGFKAGADLFLNKKSTIGVLINGNISQNEMKTDSKTPISYIPTGVVDRILTANNESENKRNNVNFNLNYRYVDTAGRELNMDADYGLFRIKSDQVQPNVYYDPSMNNQLSEAIYNFISPTDIDIYTFKADYEQPYKGGKLGVGLKTSVVSTSNNFARFNVIGNSKDLDVDRSNHFDYTENINALYVNYNKSFKGFAIQAGLRMENTNNKGESYALFSNGSINEGSGTTPLDRNYTNLFPSASVTFNKNPMKQWSFTYSRRIDRPAYQDLNPFEFKLDEYTFQKGNTDLLPQYTNSFGITHVYKYKLTATLNYSHVADMFTQLVDTTENSKTFITKENLANQDIVSLNLSYPYMYKSFMAFMNLNTFYSMYQADFGGGSRKIDLDVFSFTFYMQNTIRFGKKKAWTGELSGWYAAPSIWQGTFKSRRIYSIDAGMQKNILKGKGNLKASVSDIFRTLRWNGTSNFAGQLTVASGNFESRQFKINFTYRFGNNQVKAARQRNTGVDDESKRVGSGGAGGIGQ
ncbi:MAG: TonB-dependent receptor [Chitinophagaceae bacterium]|nr:TonB-dependent receptor [Chitinophagaceae bacterium]